MQKVVTEKSDNSSPLGWIKGDEILRVEKDDVLVDQEEVKSVMVVGKAIIRKSSH